MMKLWFQANPTIEQVQHIQPLDGRIEYRLRVLVPLGRNRILTLLTRKRLESVRPIDVDDAGGAGGERQQKRDPEANAR